MALGWIGAMMALASVVKNPNSSCSPSTGALLGPRAPRHLDQRPAKANSGLAFVVVVLLVVAVLAFDLARWG
jgi:hypothetical protein